MSNNCRERCCYNIAGAILALLLCALPGAPCRAAAQSRLSVKLQEYLAEVGEKANKGNVLGFYVAEAATGREIFNHGGEQLLIPASVLKLATSLTVLKTIGAAYRFPTEVFVDSLPSENDPRLDTSLGLDEKRQKPWTAGNLYLRGYGDPALVSEQVWDMAQAVRARGIEEVQDVVVDDTLFRNPPRAGGPRPYQAALSAVSLNSNCYTVTVAPAGPGAPAFTALTPGAPYTLRNQVRTRPGKQTNLQISQLPFSASFAPGAQEKVGDFESLLSTKVLVDVRGVIGHDCETEVRYFTAPDPAAYLGSVLRFMLEKAGVAVKGGVLRGETPGGAKQLMTYESKSVAEILRDLNHYSSNYLAGQLVFAMGQGDDGYFREETGLERVRAAVMDLGYKPGEFVIADGSGLSRANRLTAQQLVRILVTAYRDFSIAPDFMASLSRFGHSGTLKKRRLLNEKETASVPTSAFKKEKQIADGVWGKTGTLDGVSSIAGFLENPGGVRYAFAVINNGPEGKELATEVEDELVRILIRTP